MCIAFVATNACDGNFPLIVALNRDESPHRPTAILHQWDHGDFSIIGGRDLESSGTWFGWSARHQRFAVLTNRRRSDVQRESQKSMSKYTSRGLLVCDVLRDGSTFFGRNQDQIYRPFNLLLGSVEEGITHISEDSISFGGEKVEQNIAVVTNADSIDPNWPKARRGKELFQQILLNQSSTSSKSVQELAETIYHKVLLDAKSFTLEEQPADERAQGDQVAQVTGSIFIPKNKYWHTLSSTVLIVDKNNNSSVIEWTHPTCNGPRVDATKTTMVVETS